MNEELNPYDLDDFSYEVLQLYLKYGYGYLKMYDVTFFTGHNDESAILTLKEFSEKVEEYRRIK